MNLAVTMLAIAAVVLMTTAVIVWPRRHTAYWIVPFLGLSTAVSIWLIGYALELSTAGLGGKLFWARVEYIGITFTPVAWFLFAYQFLNQKPFSSKMLLLLSIVPLSTILIIYTNNQHNLFWTQSVLDESGPAPMLVNTFGGWFWFHSAYSYLLILGGIALFVRTIKLYPQPFRWQSVVLIFSAALPLLGNIIYLAGFSPVAQFDLTPFMFALSALLIIWGVVRLDLFDIIPIARRMVVESLPEGIILLDLHGRILDVNKVGQQLLAADNRRIVGRPLAELPTDLAQQVSAFTDPTIDEEIRVTRNGDERYFSVQIRPFYITGPHPRARILILRDISRRITAELAIRQRNLELQQLFTEAQAAREAAEEANKAKSSLLAKVSHELRTPLSVILGNAEMLQEGIHGDVNELQNRSLNRIIENSGYLNEQVNDLLDLSRIGAGTFEIRLYEFDLHDALEQAMNRLQPQAESKKLALRLNLSPQMPRRLWGNSIRLQQIVINLTSNAIKFTNKGQVEIDVAPAGSDAWCVRVTDTGRGIPETELNNIFQPFHQLGKSMIHGQSGVGLGLTIVQELVNALGGKIQVESKMNQGSTFCVTLPLQLQEAAKGETIHATAIE
ncbi:MAG: PAS domain-containing protein [Ardenticatenaceae bacterium]|nr:PAS domain-containing protein [Ardenticatenaceae bacterium]